MNTMNIKNLILIGTVVVATAVSGYFLWNKMFIIPINDVSIIPTPSLNAWEIYKNTAHSYSIQYPSNIMNIGPLDAYDYSTPIEIKDAVFIFSVGNESYDNNILQSYVGIVVWTHKGESGFNAEENNYLINLELESFAEAIRMYQINDQNQDIKNKHIGDLQKVTFASSTAFSFTLSGGFVRGESGGGYVLPPKTIYNYLFVENQKREKFMIWYPKDDPSSQKIIDSFEFTDDSTTASK